MKLFEINDAIRQVADRENIDEQTLKDTLDSLETTREDKLDGIAGLIEDFSEWWNDPNGEEWYDLAANYFDGHELTERDKNEII